MLKAVPTAGELNFGVEELKAKPDNFCVDELKKRLGKPPAASTSAIRGEPGDPTYDLTAPWPVHNRMTVKLAIEAPETNAIRDAATFDPVVGSPEGVGAPRTRCSRPARPAYAVSLLRRTP